MDVDDVPAKNVDGPPPKAERWPDDGVWACLVRDHSRRLIGRPPHSGTRDMHFSRALVPRASEEDMRVDAHLGQNSVQPVGRLCSAGSGAVAVDVEDVHRASRVGCEWVASAVTTRPYNCCS